MIIRLDGRRLAVDLTGAPEGPPVFALNGTPNSRLAFDGWVSDARERGLRLITLDRPGYGASDPNPGYSVADGAADVAAVADRLGLERFAVWGVSGGGPYALACAALFGERVVAAASLGGVAPWQAPGLDYFEGMGEDNVQDTQLLLANPAAARRKVIHDREEALGVTVETLREAFASLVSDEDARVLAGPFGDYMVRSMREGLAAGEQGWWDDGVAHLSPWGFALDAITVPVAVWHGRHDRFVPFGHGEWLAATIPTAQRRLSDRDGHLTVVAERIGEVHVWLAEHF